MKYNHAKAQKILNENLDKNELKQLQQKLHSSITKSGLIFDFGLSIGKKLANQGPDNETLKQNIIIMGELLYKVLSEDTVKNAYPPQSTQDDLFEIALRGMLHGLSTDQAVVVAGSIEDEMYE